MATTRKTTAKSTRRAPAKAAPRAKASTSLAARTGRTIKERPYVSAAIATGAVTAVAAAAAGAFFFSRRDKNLSLAENGEKLVARVKDGLSDASVKVKDLAERGSKWAGIAADKSQIEISEEALTLKQTGAKTNSIDAIAADDIKAGAVAY